MTEEEFKAEIEEGMEWFHSRPVRKFFDYGVFDELMHKTHRLALPEGWEDNVDEHEWVAIGGYAESVGPLPDTLKAPISEMKKLHLDCIANGVTRMIEDRIIAVIIKAKAEGMTEERAHQLAAESMKEFVK